MVGMSEDYQEHLPQHGLGIKDCHVLAITKFTLIRHN